jgi:hypothetical protein
MHSRRSVVTVAIAALTGGVSGCTTLAADDCGDTPVTEGPVESP